MRKKCTLKMGREEFPESEKIGKMVAQGFDLKRDMDVMKERLDAIKKRLAEALAVKMADHKAGTAHVIYDGMKGTVSLRDVIEISDVETLQELLGDRFEDLVDVKVTHKPARKLREMAIDGDAAAVDLNLRACLTVKEAPPSVSFKLAA